MIPWWALVALGALEWLGVFVSIATWDQPRRPRKAWQGAVYMVVWGGVGTVLVLAGLTGVSRHA